MPHLSPLKYYKYHSSSYKHNKYHSSSKWEVIEIHESERETLTATIEVEVRIVNLIKTGLQFCAMICEWREFPYLSIFLFLALVVDWRSLRFAFNHDREVETLIIF